MAKKKYTRNKRSKKAGKALASGGFGCIFKPALKCKSKKNRVEGVSKLSVEENGKEEMREITKILSRLKKIKNYAKYYLLDVEMCIPDKLTKEDMEGFNEKCFALTRYNITEKNVNNKLDKLTSINMPDAGIDMKDWLVEDGRISGVKIFKLNEIVINMLKTSVPLMNKAGVVHNDLKDRNIMVDKYDVARIIDWGLAGVVKDGKIPVEILNRPLQYNTPFSSIIISEEFKLNYDFFLERVKEGTILFNAQNVRNYVINEYLIKLARYYGYYDDNVVIFNKVFSSGISDDTYLSDIKRQNLIEYGYYLYYFSDYITNILMHFTTSDYKFMQDRYFNEVYRYNADIFGLITVYYTFFEIEPEKIEIPKEKIKIFLNRLRSLLVNNLYVKGYEKINIAQLIREIRELNKFIGNKRIEREIKVSRSMTRPKSLKKLSLIEESRSKSKARTSRAKVSNNDKKLELTNVVTEYAQ